MISIIEIAHKNLKICKRRVSSRLTLTKSALI